MCVSHCSSLIELRDFVYLVLYILCMAGSHLHLGPLSQDEL